MLIKKFFQPLILYGFLVLSMTLNVNVMASHADKKATRACMLDYLSCQKSCRQKQETKKILICLNHTCTRTYQYCIDKVNKNKKN